MYVGVLGQVYDVSSSENFDCAAMGYGQLWAGRDASYALATLSLKPEDVNRLDWSVDSLDETQLTALAGWAAHFAAKYPVVGELDEYRGRSFELPAVTAGGAQPSTLVASATAGDRRTVHL